MKKRKIMITCGTILLSLLCLSNIKGSTLSYEEVHKTQVNYENFSKTVYEGKTQEENLSSANQTMNFVSFDKNAGLELVHWNYNSGSKWANKNVLELAQNYESKNPGHKVMAGINGDFFNMASPYEPMNTQISNNEILRSGYDYFDTVGFNDNKMVTRRESFQFSKELYLKVYNKDDYVIKEIMIDNLNGTPEPNQTSLYLPGYLANISCKNSMCYNVKNADYTKSEGSNPSGYYYFLKGKIDNKNADIAKLDPLEFTIMTRNNELQDLLDVGIKVKIERSTNSEFDFMKSASGYAGNLIVNKKISEYGQAGTNGALDNEKGRHPRTVLGVKPNGEIMFGCIDGRNPSLNRVGVSLKEAAKILEYYGCEDAIAFDGGGSSTLIIRENEKLIVANHVSNANQELRKVADAWFLVKKAVDVRLTETLASKKFKNYSVQFFEKDKIQQVYAVLNGKKELIDKNIKEYTMNFTNEGKNYLYFELHYEDKKIISNCYIADTYNITPTKLPPTDFEIKEATYTNGMLNLKIDYFDNANMLTKAVLRSDGKDYLIKLSTKTCSISLPNNRVFYFDFYYEYFDRKLEKKTYSIKNLIIIKNSEVFIVKDYNNIFYYLLGDEMLNNLRES